MAIYLKEWEYCENEVWQRVKDIDLNNIFVEVCDHLDDGPPADDAAMEATMEAVVQETQHRVDQLGWKYCPTFPWVEPWGPAEALRYRYCEWVMKSHYAAMVRR